MMHEDKVKGQIRHFYDQVGWQKEADGYFQNARYEDLRPVSSEYIHRCHLRVKRYLKPSGDYLLDAGSGPVQYDEYLTYSENYNFRVCMDLSIVALKEARQRLPEKGLCVVADIARLPFKPEAFDGIVSLHTIHHVPIEQKMDVYAGLYKCLKPGSSMVTVDGWNEVPLQRAMNLLMAAVNKIRGRSEKHVAEMNSASDEKSVTQNSASDPAPLGTYVLKTSANWFKQAIGTKLPYKILVWRSVSVKFLRTVIHSKSGGRFWLKLLYRLEELFPKYFGENGQYPIILIQKPE